jgi:hypothetical protein
VLMGDQVEAIAPDDIKRFDALGIRPGEAPETADLADLVPTQYRVVAQLLAPLRGRILGCLLGNHELTHLRKTGSLSLYSHSDPPGTKPEDASPGLCERLGAEPFGYSARFDVSIWFRDEGGRKRRSGKAPDLIRRVTCHHGAGAAVTPGGKLNKALSYAAIWQDADVVLWAHSHAMTDWIQPRLLKPAGEARDHQYHVVLTGGFNRTYSQGMIPGYGERAAYPPTAIGAPVVRMYRDGGIGVECRT